MNMQRTFSHSTWIFALAIVALFSAESYACSVCFGDPDSPLTKGAVWGVFTLVGIIGVVLGGVAGTGIYWIHRSRKIDAGLLDKDGMPINKSMQEAVQEATNSATDSQNNNSDGK